MHTKHFSFINKSKQLIFHREGKLFLLIFCFRASSSSWSNNVHLTRTTDVVPSEYSNMDEPIYPYVSRAFKEDQKRKSSE